MPLSSMTGFARSQGSHGSCTWTWEIKSVNGKGLDLRCKMPPGFEAIEPTVREHATKRMKRGNVMLLLNLRRSEQRAGYRINNEVLDQIVATLPELSRRVPDATPPSLDGLLALRGVIETAEEEENDEERAALHAAVLSDLDQAIDQLVAVRNDEGMRMTDVLTQHLETIAELTERASTLGALQPETIQAKLNEQVNSLLESVPALPQDRLVQEAALLMTKADIREELDRLRAHIEAAHDLMAQGSAIGRKLDFLCQEFNREANTLCSKSGDVELTRLGLDLKAAIEQLREQVQNIE